MNVQLDTEKFYCMRNLGKRYLDNIALTDINMTFDRGVISGLIGKNGAGKSTLVNIMYGAVEHSEGSIFIEGREVSGLTPGKAQEHGIFLVPQRVQYPHDLTVAQNLFLGHYPRTVAGFIDTRHMLDAARNIMKRFHLDISPGVMVGKLSLEQRRLLDVAKAFWVYDAKMVILDETTAALSVRSKEALFEVIRSEARNQNRSIVFISHRLKEIMEICDCVSILRDGRNVGSRDMESVTPEELAELIIGKKQDIVSSRSRGNGSTLSSGYPDLDVKRLSLRDVFRDVSFSGTRNEIIGIAGMLGSGYDVILRCLGGVDRRGAEGEVIFDGKTLEMDTPEKVNRAGLSYLTSNREEEGLFHTMTICQNMFCGAYKHFSNRFGILGQDMIADELRNKVRDLDIKLHSPDLLIDSLSGGNKQKVIVSRLLNQKADVLLFDEIAEGIDIEARTKLLRFVDEVARNGRIIIMASNVVEDLMTICDRILIINHGKLCRIFARHEFDEQEIYSAIQGLECAVS